MATGATPLHRGRTVETDLGWLTELLVSLEAEHQASLILTVEHDATVTACLTWGGNRAAMGSGGSAPAAIAELVRECETVAIQAKAARAQ